MMRGEVYIRRELQVVKKKLDAALIRRDQKNATMLFYADQALTWVLANENVASPSDLDSFFDDMMERGHAA